MLPISSSPNNNNNNKSIATAQPYCSLKRVLIPLICILIVFLIDTNFRSLYLEYANPIVAGGNEDVKQQVEKLMEPNEDSDSGNFFHKDHREDDIWPEEEEKCFKNTTNYYRPPNITNAQKQSQRKRTKHKKNKKEPTIPRRLIFTYSTNLFDCYFPTHLYDNVQNTIQVYADFWGIHKTQVEVLFFDDNECEEVIRAVEPRLIPIFLEETNGSYRGDICRVAALYMYGGYYLDVDIQPIQPLDPPKKVDFITAQAGNNVFFQAILAVKPRHVLMKHTLETMLDDWYMIPSIMRAFKKTTYDPYWFRSQEYADLRLEHVIKFGFDPKHQIGILMGPVTLRIAFDRMRQTTTPWLLDEIENRLTQTYPNLVRDTPHWGCNFMVHDETLQKAYFYSRCVGTALCPNLMPFYPVTNLDDDVEDDADLCLIGDGSCTGRGACDICGAETGNTTIGNDSCIGSDSCMALGQYSSSPVTVGDGSCTGESSCNGFGFSSLEPAAVGDGSCKGRRSCEDLREVIVGSGSCNCDGCCLCLEFGNVIIPPNSCNSLGADECCEISADSFCNPMDLGPGLDSSCVQRGSKSLDRYFGPSSASPSFTPPTQPSAPPPLSLS